MTDDLRLPPTPQQWEEAQALIDALREEKAGLRKIHSDFLQSEGGWIWAGDGDDHPESLACPVVVKPEQVREWVAAEAERDRLKEAAKKVIFQECKDDCLPKDIQPNEKRCGEENCAVWELHKAQEK